MVAKVMNNKFMLAILLSVGILSTISEASATSSTENTISSKSRTEEIFGTECAHHVGEVHGIPFCTVCCGSSTTNPFDGLFCYIDITWIGCVIFPEV